MARISEPLVAKLIELVSDGMAIHRACTAVDVHDSTWRRWRQKGEADLEAGNTDTLHARLCTGVQEGRREAEHKALRAIRAAGFGVKLTERTTTTVTDKDGEVRTTVVVKERVDRHWTALAWWLERTFGGEYARVTRQWVSGPDEQPLEFSSVDEMHDQVMRDLEAFEAELAAANEREAHLSVDDVVEPAVTEDP